MTEWANGVPTAYGDLPRRRAAVDPEAGGAELPQPPGRLRAHLASHPRRTDVTWAVLTVLQGMSGGLLVWVAGHRQESVAGPLLTGGHLFALLGLGIAIATVRRTRPWLVLALSLVALLTSAGSIFGIDIMAPSVALYGLAVYGSARAAWLGMAAVAAGFAADTWLIASDRSSLPVAIVSATMATMWCLAVTALSVNQGNRRRYTQALRDRARALARERDQSARLAAAGERARIAREMHDVVAHSLTVIVTLADGAATMIDKSPERSREAMAQVAATGREAVAEMRRMLGVLRSEEGEEAAPRLPQPGIGDLMALVEEFRTAGLPVRLELGGRMPADPALQLAAFRIVQEGLTNALRYARRPSRVDAVVTADATALHVSVTDNGLPHDDGAPPRSSLGTGHGLVGIRERVQSYGGELTAAPRPDGGWRLAAVLPLPESDRRAQIAPHPSEQHTPSADGGPPAPSSTPTGEPHQPDQAASLPREPAESEPASLTEPPTRKELEP